MTVLTSTQGGHPLSTVYSFVPIPGAQQHKRPRRRYEEIERMYKCGWNGCEKAYGTLNHLNAHVTMQSHGTKRTPEGKRHRLFPTTRRVSCVLISRRVVVSHVVGNTHASGDFARHHSLIPHFKHIEAHINLCNTQSSKKSAKSGKRRRRKKITLASRKKSGSDRRLQGLVKTVAKPQVNPASMVNMV